MRAAQAAAAAAAALAIAAAVGDPAAHSIDARLAALATEVDPRAAAALAAIDDSGRRLLAARAYLRSAATMAERWSWSAAEAAAFGSSTEKHALDAAIARVRCAFEAANPGYTLWVNPEFRSFDVQLERWNSNESVGRAGANLLAAVQRELAASDPGAPESPAGREALRRLLLEHRPAPVPTLAAPGLSPHGRMRAIDFQVEFAGRIVADTDSESVQSVWIAGGWKERLRAAIMTADAGFAGPLAIPDEPWHYDFRPQVGQGNDGHGPACGPAA